MSLPEKLVKQIEQGIICKVCLMKLPEATGEETLCETCLHVKGLNDDTGDDLSPDVEFYGKGSKKKHYGKETKEDS